MPLLFPTGLAVAVVVTSVTATWDATAELSLPLVAGLAVAGIGLTRRPFRLPPVHPAVPATFAATYVVFLMPVLASGEATFAGYVTLDDTATYLGMLDRVLEHGPSSDGLAPSTYEAALSFTLDRGYPVGSLLPLGVASRAIGIDAAWTWQPYLSVLAAMLALCLYRLAVGVIRSPWLRAVAATTAASSALLYGFGQWGGVKELFAALMIALLVATMSLAWRPGPRGAVVPAVVAAALLDGLSLGAGIWLVPIGMVTLVAAVRRGVWKTAAGAVAATLVLSLPALQAARSWVPAALDDGWEMGQLTRPLDGLQLLGIWPAGDFRLDPEATRSTIVLVGVCLVSAVLGLREVVVRRVWWPIVYLGSTLVGVGVAYVASGPWIEAKALAVASPAALLVALVGVTAIAERGRIVEGTLLLTAIVGGVAWSNVLAARHASLAPRDRLAELETVGERFARQGPALMNEYQPYGVRHFLRNLDPEAASELRRRPIPLRDGTLLDKGEAADIRAFAPDAVGVYRTLVLTRSPTAGAPGAPFRLVWRGRFYDVWQRPG